MTNSRTDDAETVLVVNPHSGSGDHAESVRDRATLLGYSLRKTEREGHAVELAQSAASEGADEIVAVGGDGTLNEVVTGVDAADALDRVTVGVIPTGTGNDFAGNLTITGIDDGFDVLETGERRRLDIGMADERPFINSCVAGITADASEETTPELKSRLGVLAYVLTTLQTAREFTGIDLTASLVDGSNRETVWDGSASVVLVGNGRRFSTTGSEQANIEDGLLDVTIIENVGSLDLASDRLLERIFDREGDHLERILASSLELSVEADDSTAFSLDGEIVERKSIALSTRRGAIEMPVGRDYEPDPYVE